MKENLLIILLCLTLISCSNIKRKSQDVVDKTKKVIVEKKDATIDKIFPTFDSEIPDTKANKKRFKDFFGFEPTPDVNELYCFDDQIGIDSKFLFSFKCDTTTKNRIVAHLNLRRTDEPDNFSSGLWQNFPWWDSAKIKTLRPYSFKTNNEYYRYLWYDESKHKVYYIDFDM